MSQEHKHDRQILIFLVAALMIGGGVIVVTSPSHPDINNVINPSPVPVKLNGTPFVTTNPYIILTPDMNPVYPDTLVNFTATPVGFNASNYQFMIGAAIYQSGPSNQFSYYITNLGGHYEGYFAVNATDASGAYPDGVYNSTEEYVVLPPSISINTSQASVDPGRQVEFNSSFTTNLHPCGGVGYYGPFPLPNYTYHWFVNGNEESSTGSDMNYTFDSEGNYTIGVELSNSTGPLVHHFFQNYTYRVDPPLKAVVSSSDNPADIGQSVTFRLIPSGSTGDYTSYSYRLYNTDSNLSSVLYSGTTPSFSAILDSAGTYLISYEVESSNGFYQNATLSQFVNSDPSVSIYANKTTTDVGNPVSFLLSPIGGTPPYSYSWLYSSNSTPSSYVQFATGNSTIFKFSREGTYYIFVRLTDAAGFTVNSTSLVVTVNPSFSVYISSSIGDKALLGERGSITLNCIGGSGQSGNLIEPSFWVTNPNGLCIDSGAMTNQYSFNGVEIGVWHIKSEMTDAAGSVARATYEISVYSNNIKISFHLKHYEPVGVLVNLNASVSTIFSPPSISQISYIWTINGVNYSGNNYLYDFATPGIYNITLTVGALTSFTTSTSSDQNRTYATVIASSPGNSSSIIINPKETPISGGVSFSWYTSFKNSSEYSYYLLIQGNGASPTQVRTLSNGTLYIEANVFYSNYAAGTYSITLIVYNNKSQSNQSTMGFSVSLSQSNQVTLSTVIEWFGGLTNFIVVVGTIIGIGGTIWAIHANENPNVIIESGNGNQSKKILVKGKKIRGKK